jgi:hypothetical protein
MSSDTKIQTLKYYLCAKFNIGERQTMSKNGTDEIFY